LLEAFVRLADAQRHARLIIIGDGPERANIATLVAQLNLESRVRLIGLQTDTAMYYAAADLFVSTSYGWEALGIATVEAQAAGLPVVVTDAGGASEAFVPDLTGLLVPTRDPERLAEALGQLVADVDTRLAMGRAGRTHATTRFAVAPMVDAVAEVYRAALANS
jgi:glycosyltransferase involved in cell wall biosynthesis